uniref:Uncharacterized protein n=1 Tax=Lepeophtheirus salmonis TaxID=72036 RepID=A0A0K2T8Z8_LEPSM
MGCSVQNIRPKQWSCVSWRSTARRCLPSCVKPCEKIGQEAYYNVLRFTILPWLKDTYPEDNYMYPKMVHPQTHQPNTRSSAQTTWLIFGPRTCGRHFCRI